MDRPPDVSSSSTPLRVLVPYRKLRPTTNPYIVMLHRALDASSTVEPVAFSFRKALLGGYDVVHLHWPETIFGTGSPWRRLARVVLAHLFALRVRVLKVPVVRTVHNLDRPSGLWVVEYAYLRAMEKLTTLRIFLNETTPDMAPSDESVTILHGHYRDWFAERPHSATVPGRIGFVGLVRRYKNVIGLITAFRQARAEDDTLSLLIAGNPSDDTLSTEIAGIAARLDAVELDLRFLDEDAFVEAVTSTELVALPYHHMHNSGTALAALSANRAVLVPLNDANCALRREVGDRWVLMFDGELDGRHLLSALEEFRAGTSDKPDLSRRDWDDAGEAHVRAYLRAAKLRRSLR